MSATSDRRGDDEPGASRSDLVGLGRGHDGAGADQDVRVVLRTRLGDRLDTAGRGERDLQRGDAGLDERLDAGERGIDPVGADDREQLPAAEFGMVSNLGDRSRDCRSGDIRLAWRTA
jgi:hypothetical protein